MQIRHAKRGDEAPLAFLLEDHERHYGSQVADGAGAGGAAFPVDAPPGGTTCLVAERDGRLAGFAILNPYFPGPNLSRGLFLKKLYVSGDARDLNHRYRQQRLAALLRPPRPPRHATREKVYFAMHSRA